MVQVFMLGQQFLDISHYPVNFLCVLDDAAQLLLVEVGSDLLAEQDLADHVTEVRRSGTVFWKQNTKANQNYEADVRFNSESLLGLFNFRPKIFVGFRMA